MLRFNLGIYAYGALRRAALLRLRGFDRNTLLTLIGNRQLAWIDDNFKRSGIERRWSPLKPNTLAQRRGGSSKPLMDTGRLRGSFGMTITGNHVVVGSRDKRAPWHQYGTRPYIIVPKNAKFLRFKTVNGVVFSKKVHHPGLPARPMLPSKGLARRLSVEVINKFYEQVTRQANGAH
jgi:phage gpG-like protein